MTDYDDKEESVQDSAPVELYEFVGTYRNYFMTSDAIAHLFNSSIYNPVPGLKRGSLKVGTHGDDNVDISVEIPTIEQICRDYAFQTTPPSLFLTIYRLQRDAVNFVPYWKGKVAAILLNDQTATFKIPSKFSYILQGVIPSVVIQPPCNHVLFDELCKVSRSANSVNTEVLSVSGRVVTVADLGAFAEGWFVGGEIAIPARNERRSIVAQTATALTVNYEFSKIGIGTEVQVAAGCDHSYDGAGGCPKYANKPNFGGLPFVPGESNNIFVSGVK